MTRRSPFKVLLLAPHPFYQDRGTPIAVDLLLQTLSARGDDVDVVTYHEGVNRFYAGPGTVTIHRITPPPGCRNIRPGFSLKKLLADVYLFRKAGQLMKQRRYDLVHAVEESAFMARCFKRRYRTPYIFDMDSSMPEQIVEKMPYMKWLLPVMRTVERGGIRDAVAVAAVCDALADVARRGGATRIALLRDVPLLDTDPNHPPGEGFRRALNIRDGLCLLYLGNLEAYQGIELLIRSFARLPSTTPAHLVIIGGVASHIEKYRELARELQCADRVYLPGPRPLSDMAALMADADILVSPRTKGTNTPMKIYSYMAAGKAILATNLFTHTQVLDTTTACLAPPEEAGFALAMSELLANADRRSQLGREAAHVVQTRYSLPVFQQTLNELYDGIAQDLPSP